MAKSAKGKNVNMQALMIQNQHTVALGNARMNARGDILGKNGKIVKTREELAKEYNKTPANKVVSVPLTKDVVQQVKTREIKEATANAEVIKKQKQQQPKKPEKTE